jgi:hypothetical protein
VQCCSSRQAPVTRLAKDFKAPPSGLDSDSEAETPDSRPGTQSPFTQPEADSESESEPQLQTKHHRRRAPLAWWAMTQGRYVNLVLTSPAALTTRECEWLIRSRETLRNLISLAPTLHKDTVPLVWYQGEASGKKSPMKLGPGKEISRPSGGWQRCVSKPHTNPLTSPSHPPFLPSELSEGVS